MKAFLVIALSLGLLVSQADARGGSSSSGGRGGFSSSSGRSMSSAPAPAPRPAVAPAPAAPRPAVAPAPAQAAPKPATPAPAAPTNPNKGSFNSANTPAKPATTTAAPATRTTTTTTTTSNTTTNRSYGGNFVSPGPMYGGWGMGYGYTNGLLTGMIIAGMMHPHNTVMYTGPGMYANNALLYPNGQVVNQQGVHVGNYSNGSFTPVTNGQVVAQQVPQDAVTSAPAAPQPVTIIKTGPSTAEIVGAVVLGFLCIILLLLIFI